MEEESLNEISEILQDLGDDSPTVHISNFSGIIYADTRIDPLMIIREIKKTILEDPWKIRYCHRFIPIYEVTQSTVEDIVHGVKNQIGEIVDTDTYRITIEKRGSDLSSKEIIDSIANSIPNKVSLEHFDWNIIIQIIGAVTGVSVLRKNDIISTLKLKRDSME